MKEVHEEKCENRYQKYSRYGRAGLKQFRVVAETDRNYPMGLTIDGKRIHVGEMAG